MRREGRKRILKQSRLRERVCDAVLFSLVFLIALSLLFGTLGSMLARDGIIRTISAVHHNEHLSDDYAPMVIPFNGKKVTVAPVITCTTLEDDVFKPHHHPCRSAKTLFVDDEWSDKDASYTYLFEDWVDYDWNDINVSLCAATNEIIELDICLEDREAAWKNPFCVEITPESLTVDVHWNSTDYPGDHVIRVKSNETVDIEVFAESIPGDTAFITIIPIVPPVASFIYLPLYPQVCEHVNFSASASTPNGGYIISYEWDFGDDSPRESGMVVTHHYAATGTYTVTLNVTDSEGSWDTESRMITVTPRAYTLTITSTSGGTTNPAPNNHTYIEGTLAAITATAFTDYIFDHWELDGESVGSDNPINVTMDADHILHAVFTQIAYTLTIYVTGEGTTDPAEGSHIYGSGSTATVSTTADSGWHFDHWVLDGEDAGSSISINVLMDSNHDLEAIFTQNTCTLIITSTAGGTTNPAPGDYVYSSGTVVPVTATPQDGYHFDHWVLDSSNAGSDNLITVIMDKQHVLHAVFEKTFPVGGHAMPIDKTDFLALKINFIPGICIAFVLLFAMVATIILIRHRNKRLKCKRSRSTAIPENIFIGCT